MSTILDINRNQAKFSPESEFDDPAQVAAEIGLTRAEKLTVLRSWAFDVQRRLDAAAEGMAPEPESAGHREPVISDSELLRSIELEIESLESGQPSADES